MNFFATFRRAAVFVDRILKGANIPIEQATKFEVVINLKTAKASALMCRQRCSPWPMR